MFWNQADSHDVTLELAMNMIFHHDFMYGPTLTKVLVLDYNDAKEEDWLID